jgi:biopolymer transport protein ExbB
MNFWSFVTFYFALLFTLLITSPGSLFAQNQPSQFSPPGFSQPGYGQPSFGQSNFGQPGNAQPNNPFSTQPLNANPPSVRVAQLPQSATNVQTNKPAEAGTEGAATEDAIPSRISVRNLLQTFSDGGLMMYPIALCSMACLVFVFERLIFLRRGRVIPKPFVKRLIEQLEQQQLDREEALELCEKNPSPIAVIITSALKKYGRPAVEVEQAVIDTGERVTNQLRRHLRLLSAISNLSPLLGLLGTVLGMIEAFNVIASTDAMGRPELLAGGIGQAMLTTAAGLFVAIPAYIAYMYFLGHTDRLVMDMDAYAQQVIEAVSAEGLQENDTSRTRSRSRKAA